MKFNQRENVNNTKLDQASEQSGSGNEYIGEDKALGSGEIEQNEDKFGDSTESTNRTEIANGTLLMANGTSSANGKSEKPKTKLSVDQESPMNVSTEAESEKSNDMVDDKGIANNPSDAGDAETGKQIEAEVHDTAEEPKAEAVKEKPVETNQDEMLNHSKSANGTPIMANGTSSANGTSEKPKTKPSVEKESPRNASTEAESEKSNNTTNDKGIGNRTSDAGGAETRNNTEDLARVKDTAEEPTPEDVKEKPVEKMPPANEVKEDFPAADAVKEKPISRPSTAVKSSKGKLFPVKERAVALQQKKKKERSSRAD